jgi:hypothetical protein
VDNASKAKSRLTVLEEQVAAAKCFLGSARKLSVFDVFLTSRIDHETLSMPAGSNLSNCCFRISRQRDGWLEAQLASLQPIHSQSFVAFSQQKRCRNSIRL